MFDAYIEAWRIARVGAQQRGPSARGRGILSGPNRAAQSPARRLHDRRRRARARRRGAPGAGERRRSGGDAALWRRLLAQGPDLDARHPDHAGLEEFRELSPARRRRTGGALAQCGRDPARQNHYARTRRPSDHRGRAMPAGAQSVEPRIQRRRLQRRRRGAGRGRDGSDRRGHRRRRLDSYTRGLLRRGRV